MADYRLTPAAELDLERIWRYSAESWGTDQADRYIDVLVQGFDSISEAPKAAPKCDYIRSGYGRQAVERHVIYYRLGDSGLVVVRILHDRMDPKLHL